MRTKLEDLHQMLETIIEAREVNKAAAVNIEKQYAAVTEKIQKLCPHNHLEAYGHGQDQCADCGLTGL